MEVPLLLLISAALLLGVLGLLSSYLSLWLQAYVSGVYIGLFPLVWMSLRHVNPKTVVRVKIMAAQAGLADIPLDELEAQYLAGGDIHRVTLALITANRARISLDWKTAAAIDLAGRDILEAVQVSVTPKLIYCPARGIEELKTLDGVAKDGIQLKVQAVVTVRTNLIQLIGGATESTVIARVGQGIVSAIGSCDTYRQALADPAVITRQVLAKGLDSQTSFAIVSIDIARIEVGENLGAKLRLIQATTDIRIAQAVAEKRRAMAIARQQEMVTLTKENGARLVLAEAQIPPAVSEAFRVGPFRHATRRTRAEHRVLATRGLRKRGSLRRGPSVVPAELSEQIELWESEGGTLYGKSVRHIAPADRL
ncbi:flotillin-like FloA family protein [Rubinisphaera margarita]|uniref:flotillin-like FloA family protein n=1 Tax=Rubinisphaera margarita TaxID=2909586 RepID=UPI001EE7C146|nr:flotillin-like FloA family protein [Rubinisphaera margarita]MCG6158166.1 flotillin-like FloA family protein [Rubinisphaera margarita]